MIRAKLLYKQPTVILYILKNLKPAEDLAGGVWYDDKKEYDADFVNTISNYLMNRVAAHVSHKVHGDREPR